MERYFVDDLLDSLPPLEGETVNQSPPPPPNGNGKQYPPFDMPGFLAQHGLAVNETKHDDTWGTKYILSECPFDAAHRAPDSYVAVMPSGALCFKCSHNSCAGYKWRDLRERFEPGYRDKRPNRDQTAKEHGGGGGEPQHGDKPIAYQRITAAELDAGEFDLEYLIEDALTARQPLIIAGGKKCLKTNILLDAAISLGTMTPMLGGIRVNRGCRVGVMTGESGLATIQETCRRICRAKEIDLRDVSGLIFSADLPRIGDARHHEALARFIDDDELEVLFIDPAYLCMDLDGREGSLFAAGALLRSLAKLCEDRGVTLGLCHHTKKGIADPFAPPELEHIAWAGFQEFARQWWLLGRRKAYEPGTGRHELWLSVGGSAGHSALWAADIEEGTRQTPGGRFWDLRLETAANAREEAAERLEAERQTHRNQKHAAKVQAAKAAIADALRGAENNTDTKRGIRERSGIQGGALDLAIAELLRTGKLTACEVERANGHKYKAFRYEFAEEAV